MSYEEINVQLDDLVAGTISEIVVKKEDFMTFRTAWLNHPQKNQIVGEAKLHGEVIYRLVSEEN